MIHLPPSTYEQRNLFYSDVEQLISPGFLTHRISVKNQRCVIRSLGPGDLTLFHQRTDGTKEYELKAWAIASSLWLVNGFSLLGEKNLDAYLYEDILQFPKALIDAIFLVVLQLFDRQSQATEALEPFLYEERSRSIWRMHNGSFGALTGILGTEAIGTNYIQRVWIAYNDVEDYRNKLERQWDGYRFIASAHAPKGVQKIEQKEAQQKETEQKRKQAIQDCFFYYKLGLLDKDGYVKSISRDHIGSYRGSKTPDQLQQEFQNWVSGEMDEHDRIVEEYKKTLLIKKEQADKNQQEKLKLLQEEYSERGLGMQDQPLVGYSLDQIEDFTKDVPGSRWVPGEGYHQSQFIQNYLNTPQKAGNLVQSEDGKFVDTATDPEVIKQFKKELGT